MRGQCKVCNFADVNQMVHSIRHLSGPRRVAIKIIY